jgi:hypothetical protein
MWLVSSDVRVPNVDMSVYVRRAFEVLKLGPLPTVIRIRSSSGEVCKREQQNTEIAEMFSQPSLPQGLLPARSRHLPLLSAHTQPVKVSSVVPAKLEALQRLMHASHVACATGPMVKHRVMQIQHIRTELLSLHQRSQRACTTNRARTCTLAQHLASENVTVSHSQHGHSGQQQGNQAQHLLRPLWPAAREPQA